MQYLVTGATGFIGSHLALELSRRGHDVRALVRDPSKASGLRDEGIELHVGDIIRKDSLKAPMKGVDGVFHTAAWYKIGVRDRELAYRTNVEGTTNVLEMMMETNVPKGVYTSTIAVFSDTKGKEPDETYRFEGRHLSVYDETKWIAHYKVALPMIEEHKLPLTIVMPGVVFGPGDTSIMGSLLDRLLLGKLPIATGKSEYSWTYIDDIVDGHIRAMDMGKIGRSYIMGGERASLADALRTASQLTGVKPPRVFLPPPVLRMMSLVSSALSSMVDVPQLYDAETLKVSAGATYLGDSTRAVRELGFSARSLRKGLELYLPSRMSELGLYR